MQTNQFWIGALLLSVVMISRCTCQVIRIDTEKKKGEAKEYPVTGPGWQSDSGEIQQENPQDRPLEAAPEVSPEPKPIQWSTLPGCNTKTSCKLDSDCSNGLLCHQGSCKAGSKCPAGASCQCKSDKFCGGGKPVSVESAIPFLARATATVGWVPFATAATSAQDAPPNVSTALAAAQMISANVLDKDARAAKK